MDGDPGCAALRRAFGRGSGEVCRPARSVGRRSREIRLAAADQGSIAFQIVIVFAAVLAAYLAGVVAATVHGLLTVHTAEQFLVTRRRCGGIWVGGSLAATIIGGSSTIGLAALAFRQGLTGSWWLLVGAAGLGCLLLFVRPLRTRPAYTLPQLIGHWYGPTMQRISAGFIAAAWLGIVGAQANAAGRILAAFLGGPPHLWTLAAGALFILYTAAGGQVSVIGTDLFQLVLILAGIGSCAAVGLVRVGGLGGLSAAVQGTLGADALAFPLSSTFRLFDLVLLLLVVGSTYLTGPDMVSRVFCSRSDQAARRGILVAIAVIVPFALVMALTGVLSRALLPAAGPDEALPQLVRTVLPASLAALSMVALLSAFLSSADTTLLTLSAVVSLDLLRRPADTGALRLTVLGAGVAAIAVGILSGGVIPSLLLGYTVFSGGLFVPILAGLAGKPLRRTAVLVACGAGGGLALAGRITGTDALIAAAFVFSALVVAADRLIARSPWKGRNAARGVGRTAGKL
jgi:SSS family solute:Na+ symporter